MAGAPSKGLDEVLRFDGKVVQLRQTRTTCATLLGSLIADGPTAELLTMPLHARGRAFGVVCMEVRPLRTVVCMAIRDALSAALHRARVAARA
jgi:hypothetical protein